jgi:hypothetical protein
MGVIKDYYDDMGIYTFNYILRNTLRTHVVPCKVDSLST